MIKLKLASAIAVAETMALDVPILMPETIPTPEKPANIHGRTGVRIRDTKRQMTKRKRKEKRKHQQKARR